MFGLSNFGHWDLFDIWGLRFCIFTYAILSISFNVSFSRFFETGTDVFSS